MSEAANHTPDAPPERMTVTNHGEMIVVSLRARRNNIMMAINLMLVAVGCVGLGVFASEIMSRRSAIFEIWEPWLGLVFGVILVPMGAAEIIWALKGVERLEIDANQVKVIRTGRLFGRSEDVYPIEAVRQARWRDGPPFEHTRNRKPISALVFKNDGFEQEICKGIDQNEARKVLSYCGVKPIWGRV